MGVAKRQRINRRRRKSSAEAVGEYRCSPICLVSKLSGSLARGHQAPAMPLWEKRILVGALRRCKAGVNGIKNPEARLSSRAMNYGSGQSSKLGAGLTAKETMGIGIPLCGLMILFGWKRSHRSFTRDGNLRPAFQLHPADYGALSTVWMPRIWPSFQLGDSIALRASVPLIQQLRRRLLKWFNKCNEQARSRIQG